MLDTQMHLKLLEAYQHYCDWYQNHSTRSEDVRVQIALAGRRIDSLLKIGFPPDFAAYCDFRNWMQDIWRRCVGSFETEDFENFKTSGTSSNKPREYPFGPRPQEWIHTFWRHVAYPFGWRPMIRLATRVEHVRTMQIHDAIEGLYQWRIQTAVLNDADVATLIQFMGRLLDQFGSLTLAALPEAHLYLTHTPAFLDFAEQNRERFNLLSWRWEPFFDQQIYRDRGIWCGDYMMDWPSGLNFYTCQAGEKHMLPIFFETATGRLNALNLMAQEVWTNDSDACEITDVVRCRCQTARPIFHHIPRANNSLCTPAGKTFFDLSIATGLRSRYCSLQFIQHQPDTVTVHYVVDGPFLDQELLEVTLKQQGFKVAWNTTPYETTGWKRIPFFRPTQGKK